MRLFQPPFPVKNFSCDFVTENKDKNLVDIVENDMAYFENLTRLDLSENSIKDIRKLSALKALNRLELQNNGIEDINFKEADNLDFLQEVDLSYNKINFPTLENLFIHEKLRQEIE